MTGVTTVVVDRKFKRIGRVCVGCVCVCVVCQCVTLGIECFDKSFSFVYDKSLSFKNGLEPYNNPVSYVWW